MDINQQISPQYTTKDQITVMILDMIDPAHFVVRESPDLLNASSVAKNFLEAEEAMQKYYASVQPCFIQLPLKDAIIVVFFKERFYRARVIRILTLSAGYLFKVYLVDHGIECTAPRDCIYEIEKDFLIHPFQAVDIKLVGIEPVSMIMNPVDLSMSYGPVAHWDPSAEIYVQDLQKDICAAYIEVQGIKDQYIYGRLYFCYESIPAKCVNHELITNSYAHFNEGCWKEIRKLDDPLEDSTTLPDNSERTESIVAEKSNPEQMFSNGEFNNDEMDFKVMFLDPIDGTVVAESSLSKDTSKSPSKIERELETQVHEELQSPEMNSEEQSPESIAQRRFLKLQKLNRMKRKTPAQSNEINGSDMKSLQTEDVRESDVRNSTDEICAEKCEKSPTERFYNDCNETVAAKPDVSPDCYNSKSNNCDNSKQSCKQSNTSDEVQMAFKNNPRQEDATMLAAQKLQKLQLLNKKLLPSPIVKSTFRTKSTNSTPTQNKIIENFSADVKTNTTDCSLNVDKIENAEKIQRNDVHQNVLNISCVDKTNSVPSHIPQTVNGTIHSAAKKDSETDDITQAQLIAQNRFNKLRQLKRKNLHSPVCANSLNGSLINSSPTTSPNENNSGINSCSEKMENSTNGLAVVEKSDAAINKPNDLGDCVNSNLNNLKCHSYSPKDSMQVASKSHAKQETESEVILENVKTLQKLQNKVRLKRMRESALKTSDVLKHNEEMSVDECSATSPTNESVTSFSHLNPISSSPNSSDEKTDVHEKSLSEVKSPYINKVGTFFNKCRNLFHLSPTSKILYNEKDENSIITDCSLENATSSEIKSTSDVCATAETESQSNITENRSAIEISSICTEKFPLNVDENPESSTLTKSKDVSMLSDDMQSPPNCSVGPKIINKLSKMSDSDDLLCEISKQIETVSDKIHVEENFIKLSTQLPFSEAKTLSFNMMSLWERQKIPVLQIGIGIPTPVVNVAEANFSSHLKRILTEIRFFGPSCIQSVVWPSIERNRSVMVIAPPHSGKTVSYVLSLVSYFTTKDISLPKGVGPYAIILCSSWEKAQAVVEFFHLFLQNMNIKIVTLCTDCRNYTNRIISLVSSCEILIATPFCLLQFLKKNCISLSRLNQFIIDDGKTIISKNKKELKNILLCVMDYAKRNRHFPQMMLCAERWDKHFQTILDKVMLNPLLFFTSFLESAIYAKVPIFAYVCEAAEKKSALLDIVKEPGKIVVCSTNAQDAVEVHHFLRWEDIRTFLVTEEMEHYIADEVIKDWKSARCMTSSHCLVITDPMLIKMCISNADCLVHYDLPLESRLQFGNRFSCIAEHFQKMEGHPRCVCHIFITESEYFYAPQIVDIIKNSGGVLSKELLVLCEKQYEDENTLSPLCHYTKAFGFCKKHSCKFRHELNAKTDKPQIIPFEGDIQALVTHVIDASHYFVRLLKYLDPETNKTVSFITKYAHIGFQLRDFYKSASEHLVEKSPVVGGSYVLEEDNKLFYRIKVLNSFPDTSTDLMKWEILYLDEGWVKCKSQLKLYKIADQINLPDPLAVEVYVCNFSTLDSCYDWNPQTTHLVKELIGNKEIHGKIVLCLGKTLWLDPVVLRLQLSNPNEYVNLFKLDQKLSECGHIKLNKNHLALLKQACEGKISLPRIIKQIIKQKVPEPEPSINYAFLDCDIYEDVYVSSVVSPHQLHVQRAKFVDCLDDLLDKINVQVEKRMLKKAHTVYKGMHCIAPFHEDNRYYRATITDVISYCDIQLFYVDFGDSGTASRNTVYSIPAEFLLLPFQAIECSLVGINAAHGGWTDSVASFLTTLIRDEAGDMKIMQLKAYNKTKCYEGGNHYEIDLWYNEKNITEQLLQAGYGVPEDVHVVSSTEMLFDDSQDHLNSEEFDLNQKYSTSSHEDMHSDEKNSATNFYDALAKMMDEEYNLNSNCDRISSDEEEILKQLKKTSSSVPEIVNNLKLFSKPNHMSKNVHCSNSLKPLITWWDTPDEINILINLKDIKVYQLDIANEGFNFNTFISGKSYSAEEKFYAEIHPAQQYQSAEGVNIHARKCTPFKWPRLTKEKRKFLHIKYDLIHIDDSDEEQQPKPINNLKPPPPQYAIQKDSSSTDEDEKYVVPWKDFAQYGDPYHYMD